MSTRTENEQKYKFETEKKKSTKTNSVDRGLAAGLLNGRERHFNKVLLCCYSMQGPTE